MSYSHVPPSPARSTSSSTAAYPPSRPSSSSLSYASPRPQRTNTSSSAREMDAAFDDSDSESDDDDDENVPLSHHSTTTTRSPRGTHGAGTVTSTAHSSSNGAAVMWDVEEEAVEGGLPRVDDPLRSGAAQGGGGGGGGGQGGGYREGPEESTYDFDRDYFLPPPGSPPPGAYPEAYLPTGPTPLTTTPAYPKPPSASSTFIRSIVPTHFTRQAPSPRPQGSDGVFANIMAKPEVGGGEGGGASGEGGGDGENGAVMAEFTQKEGPPSYNHALRDAVPTYWEHNVVAPQLGPLGSFSGSGDDLLLDGLPIGNFFGFAWNLLVSLSFQFVGFLLTYVLHTTHAAKYGSRAGLGITLIQYGLYLRSRAEEIMSSGSLDPDVGSTDPFGGSNGGGWGAWGGQTDENGVPSGGLATVTRAVVSATATATTTAALAIPTFGSIAEADAWAMQHNTTIWEAMGQPNALEVGQANEWLSFVLMSCGWFILLTSLGGYWRVKRFERSLLISQQTDSAAPGSAVATNAEASSSTSFAQSWFGSPPGLAANGEEREEGAGGRGPNLFTRLGGNVRGMTAGVRERIETMRREREGRRRVADGEDEEELML